MMLPAPKRAAWRRSPNETLMVWALARRIGSGDYSEQHARVAAA